jgi:hypothetical protein
VARSATFRCRPSNPGKLESRTHPPLPVHDGRRGAGKEVACARCPSLVPKLEYRPKCSLCAGRRLLRVRAMSDGNARQRLGSCGRSGCQWRVRECPHHARAAVSMGSMRRSSRFEVRSGSCLARARGRRPTQARSAVPLAVGAPEWGASAQGTEPPMGTGDGDDPPSPANRGWGWEWTPDPRRIGDGDHGGGPPIVGVCRAAALNG